MNIGSTYIKNTHMLLYKLNQSTWMKFHISYFYIYSSKNFSSFFKYPVLLYAWWSKNKARQHCTCTLYNQCHYFILGYHPQNYSTELRKLFLNWNFLPYFRSINLPLKNIRILLLWKLYMYFLLLYIDEQNWREIQKIKSSFNNALCETSFLTQQKWYCPARWIRPKVVSFNRSLLIGEARFIRKNSPVPILLELFKVLECLFVF